MTSDYNLYPAVDDELNFPPLVRAAFAQSIDLRNAIEQSLPDILDTALADDPTIRTDLVAKIAALTATDLDLVHKDDPQLPVISDFTDYAWMVIDPSGRLALGILNDGTVQAIRLTSNQIDLGGTAKQYVGEDGEHAWAIIDPSGYLSELRINNSGRVPEDVLSAWASRMGWNDEDIATALADLLGTYQPGLEVGYSELATAYSTTLTVGGTPMTGIVLNIVGTGRVVEFEFRAPNVYHSIANVGVNAELTLNGTVIQVGTSYSPSTTKGPPLLVKQRKALTNGVTYQAKIIFYGDAAGTSSINSNVGLPIYLSATNK